jgi:hypothetical protein
VVLNKRLVLSFFVPYSSSSNVNSFKNYTKWFLDSNLIQNPKTEQNVPGGTS